MSSPVTPPPHATMPRRYQTWFVGSMTAAFIGLWIVTRVLPDIFFADNSEDHHDGSVVSLGQDEFHVQAFIEANGRLSLFTLASDPTVVLDVKQQTPTAYYRSAGEVNAYSVSLRPLPQSGDATGRTSRFVADIPEELIGRLVEVTVPNLRIGSRRFHFTITSVGLASTAVMPSKVKDDAERDLYLTAGGKYTRSDINANNGLTASEKFRGFVSKHDHNPKSGDLICPITKTKANPNCTWIVAGREYSFCCPPCVDEFVRLAKESPDKIEEPGYYIHR